jgi:hypothetical protein
MPGKTRPCLRRKVLLNVDYSNLSLTDKKCIHTIFEKYDLLQEKNIKLQKEVYELREKVKHLEFMRDEGYRMEGYDG